MIAKNTNRSGERLATILRIHEARIDLLRIP